MIKRVKSGTEFLVDVEFVEVKDPQIVSDLCHMEERLFIPAYRFGVLYCKEGQTDEIEMFSNSFLTFNLLLIF